MSSKHMKIDSLFEGDKYRGYFKRKDGLLDFHRDDSQNDLFEREKVIIGYNVIMTNRWATRHESKKSIVHTCDTELQAKEYIATWTDECSKRGGILDYSIIWGESPEDLPILPPQMDEKQQQIIFE